MAVITNWLEYLVRRQIPYAHSVHRRTETALETADAERIPAHKFAKTVVYFSSAGYGIAVVPADQQVDLLKLGHLLGVAYIRLANETELAALFPDCELGAMPPFGDVCELPVTIDVGLAHKSIAFTLGTHRDAVHVRFVDFLRVATPKIASIATGKTVLN